MLRSIATAAALVIGLGTGAVEAATVNQEVTVTFTAEDTPCFREDTQTNITCRAELAFSYPFGGVAYSGTFDSTLFLFEQATGTQIGALPVFWDLSNLWDPESGEPPFCIEVCATFRVGPDGRLANALWSFTAGGDFTHGGDLIGFAAEWDDLQGGGSYFLDRGIWTSIVYEGLPAPIPLPATVVLLGGALTGLGLLARHKGRSAT